MDEIIIVKKDPSPRKNGRGGGKWLPVALTLMASPGDWFSLGLNWSSYATWGKRPWVLKFACVEMCTRDVRGSRGEIFVRFDPEGPDADEFTSQEL